MITLTGVFDKISQIIMHLTQHNDYKRQLSRGNESDLVVQDMTINEIFSESKVWVSAAGTLGSTEQSRTQGLVCGKSGVLHGKKSGWSSESCWRSLKMWKCAGFCFFFNEYLKS